MQSCVISFMHSCVISFMQKCVISYVESDDQKRNKWEQEEASRVGWSGLRDVPQ